MGHITTWRCDLCGLETVSRSIPPTWVDFASRNHSLILHICNVCRWKLPTKALAETSRKDVDLFQWKNITLHSGRQSNLKIDCDSLSDNDIECIANIISTQVRFNRVIGIPSGGLRLEQVLQQFCNRDTARNFPVLIVDDVLTTGASMVEMKNTLINDEGYSSDKIVGRVIFARASWPNWIKPVFWSSFNI